MANPTSMAPHTSSSGRPTAVPGESTIPAAAAATTMAGSAATTPMRALASALPRSGVAAITRPDPSAAAINAPREEVM